MVVFNSNNDQKLASRLKERIKELECLYEISKLQISMPNSSLNYIFKKILQITVKAWQYPEITQVRIVYDEQCFQTNNFKDCVNFQRADIVVGGFSRGFIEVCYIIEKPTVGEGPFLIEERSLLDALAYELSLIIERYESKEEKKLLERKLNHSDRLATLGELTAGIAHELNEPLGSILGFAELIELDNNENTQLQKDISKIIKASKHARMVIRKLMIFSKYDEQPIDDVNFNQVISDGFYLLEVRCDKAKIKVVKKLMPGFPSIKANSVQLSQLIVNLMVNAIHAMPDGGKLLLQTHYDDNNLYLIIEDNGIGIPEENMAKIFDPFFSTKEAGKGTGLGLSVVHGIVDSMKGKISVLSNLGKGSRFELSFPRKG